MAPYPGGSPSLFLAWQQQAPSSFSEGSHAYPMVLGPCPPKVQKLPKQNTETAARTAASVVCTQEYLAKISRRLFLETFVCSVLSMRLICVNNLKMYHIYIYVNVFFIYICKSNIYIYTHTFQAPLRI